jgi:hypothetical protein
LCDECERNYEAGLAIIRSREIDRNHQRAIMYFTQAPHKVEALLHVGLLLNHLGQTANAQ